MNIQVGNTVTDAANRGWFIGHFIEEKYGLRSNKDVEMRWAVHQADEKRQEWVTGETRTTVCILISGRIEFDFKSNGEESHVVLLKQGDFVMWGPGDEHIWQTPMETTTLAVRWPSIDTH